MRYILYSKYFTIVEKYEIKMIKLWYLVKILSFWINQKGILENDCKYVQIGRMKTAPLLLSPIE